MNEHLNEAAVTRIADGEEPASPHVRDCASCANALVAALQMKRAVREAYPYAAVPPSLRGRLAGKEERRPWWLAVAAAAVIAVLLAGLAFESRRTAARELVDLHATIVGGSNPIEVISTDRHTVKPWFEGKVPFAVDVPELAGTPLRLIGGRVVFWRGEPGAYMLIAKGGHRISLFEFRDDAVPPLSGLSSMTVETWSANGLRYIAVADVPASDLTALRQHPSR